MTEPETPGSDPTQLATRAVRDGDGYVLDGHKWFTSNGSIADFLDRDGGHRPGRARRTSAPRCSSSRSTRPASTSCATWPTWSSRTSTTGCSAATRRSSTRTSGSARTRCSAQEGDGFLIAQHRLVPGRIHHCMRWLGVARRAFDMMCERSLYRPVKGGLLKDKQTVQGWIADSAAEMQAARLMTLHAAWKIDQFGSSAARTDVSMIKFFGAKVLHDVVDRALQLHGGARLLDRHAARDAVPLRAPRPLRRRRRRGAPGVGRAADPARVRGARGRDPDRARADPARGREGQVRRRAGRAPASRAENGARRARAELVDLPGRVQRHQPRRLHLGGRVGDPVLHGLLVLEQPAADRR